MTEGLTMWSKVGNGFNSKHYANLVKHSKAEAEKYIAEFNKPIEEEKPKKPREAYKEKFGKYPRVWMKTAEIETAIAT